MHHRLSATSGPNWQGRKEVASHLLGPSCPLLSPRRTRWPHVLIDDLSAGYGKGRKPADGRDRPERHADGNEVIHMPGQGQCSQSSFPLPPPLHTTSSLPTNPTDHKYLLHASPTFTHIGNPKVTSNTTRRGNSRNSRRKS